MALLQAQTEPAWGTLHPECYGSSGLFIRSQVKQDQISCPSPYPAPCWKIHLYSGCPYTLSLPQLPHGHLLIPTCLQSGSLPGKAPLYPGSHLWPRHLLDSRQLPGWGLGEVTGEIFLDCRGSTKPQSRLPACWPVRLPQPRGHACGHWSLVTAPAPRGACLVACGYWEGSLGGRG